MGKKLFSERDFCTKFITHTMKQAQAHTLVIEIEDYIDRIVGLT
jgi:hypothetical protein